MMCCTWGPAPCHELILLDDGSSGIFDNLPYLPHMLQVIGTTIILFLSDNNYKKILIDDRWVALK